MKQTPAQGGEPTRSQRVEVPCPNCGDETPSPYCPTCGQRRAERRVSLRRMLAELIEDQLSLNATLPRTIGALLLHPGKLSREYVAGRIQRYIPPFRLYLVTSVIFFLLLSINVGRDPALRINVGADADTVAAAADDSLGSDSPADSLLWGERIEVNTPWALLDTVLSERLDHFRSMRPEEAAEAIRADLMRRAPTAMFLLLPIFAALLKLLYIRRKRYYVEHFVFGLHTHAFAFLLFSIMLIADRAWVMVPALLWMVIYLYVAMLRFYQQGWLKTLVKYVVMFNAYMVVFSFGMVGLFLVAVLLA